jgi:quercetin dioxygenase-like cupin family protein
LSIEELRPVDVRKPAPAHVDDRGSITDLLVKEPIEYVTIITSRQGAVRGHHYHRETFQWVYVIEGSLKLLTQEPDGPVQSRVVGRGEVVATPPNERHAMIALEDTSFMVFTRGPRGGEDYEKDTFRLATPLAE